MALRHTAGAYHEGDEAAFKVGDVMEIVILNGLSRVPVSGDGIDDIVTSLGGFNQPLVRGFNGNNAAMLVQFFAYDPTFLGGVFVG